MPACAALHLSYYAFVVFLVLTYYGSYFTAVYDCAQHKGSTQGSECAFWLALASNGLSRDRRAATVVGVARNT